MKRRNEEVDRISTLPDEILHHILSFIPFNDVAKVSLLSKRWKQVWHTFPILKCYAGYSDYGKCMKIMRSLKKTLFSRCIERKGLSKLKLEVQLFDFQEFLSLFLQDQCEELVSVIDQCLHCAILCNVKELNLRFMGWLYDFYLSCGSYNLPQFVFCSKSMEVLKLSGCKLELPRSGAYLPSLKKLVIGQIYADDHVIDNLVARCPLLEYLRIHKCEGYKSLELSCRSKLEFIERVDITGLNFQLIDTFSWPPREINAVPCKNLKRLKLSRLSFMDEWIGNQISKFLFLEYLNISDCMKLTALKISSSHLKELIIIDCWDLVEIKIATPNLSIFKYWGDIVSFFSNALALTETVLVLETQIIETQQYVKFIDLLAKFNHFSNVLDLRSNFESVIVPEELRRILSPPLTGVKHLKFTINNYHASVAIKEVVDGLLWISPHLKTMLIGYLDVYLKESTFEFSYKNQLNCEENTPHCCLCRPVSCWHSCINEVKIEQATKSGGELIDVKRYSFADDEILGRIDGLYNC